MQTVRVLVPGDDQSNDAILIALGYAAQMCELSQGSIEEVILFVPGKDSLRSTTIASVLGEKNAKILADGGTVALRSGTPMRAETIRTLKWVNKQSVVVSVYSDQRMLDQLDSIKNLHGIIAVPHVPNALQQWENTWSPQVHGASKQPAKKLIGDPIFEQALLSLTGSINLSNGVLNPRDKEHADRTLRILRVNGHKEHPNNIRSWAIKNNWNPKAADELRNLAQKIASLKSKPRLADHDGAQRTYDYWSSKI